MEMRESFESTDTNGMVSAIDRFREILESFRVFEPQDYVPSGLPESDRATLLQQFRGDLCRRWTRDADGLRERFLADYPAFGHELEDRIEARKTREMFADLSDPDLRGTILAGKYELREYLAAGSWGLVWKAVFVDSQRPIAIKFLNPDRYRSSQALELLRRETETAIDIKNPNVVGFKDTGVWNGIRFICFEYVDGGTLARLIEEECQGGMEPRRAVDLMIGVASGVAAAHEKMLIHRDLNPENVLIDGEGVPKVSDFGLARNLTENDFRIEASVPVLVVGTKWFAAPEQVGAWIPPVEKPCDVFALGALLYFCLAGKPPFPGGTFDDYCKRLKTGGPPEPWVGKFDRRADLWAICLKALELDPKKRYENAGKFRDELMRYRKLKPVHVRPAGLAKRLVLSCRRQPFVATLVALSVSAIAIAGHLGSANVRDRFRASQELAAVENRNRHDAVAFAARTALEAGDWKIADEQFASARSDHFDDENKLAIEQLDTFLPMGRIQELFERLDEIEGQKHPAELRAKLKLLRADALLCRSNPSDPTNADKLLMEIEPIVDQLAEHEQCYFRALSAKMPEEIAKQLRAAMNAKQRYQRGQALWAGFLLSSGRWEECQRQLELMDRTFPGYDPTVARQLALLAICRGAPQKQIDDALARVKAVDGEGAMKDWRAIAETHRKLLVEIRPAPGNPNFLQNAKRRLREIPNLIHAQSTRAKASLNVPRMRWLDDIVQIIERELPEMSRGSTVSANELAKMFATHPDGYLEYLAGFVFAVKGFNLGTAKVSPTSEREIAMVAVRCFETATRANSVIPWTAVEAEQFVDAFGYAAATDRKDDKLARKFAERLFPKALALSADGVSPNDRAGKADLYLKNILQFGPIADARLAALIWERLDPTNPLPFGLHSAAEAKAFNYPEAIRLWWLRLARQKPRPKNWFESTLLPKIRAQLQAW